MELKFAGLETVEAIISKVKSIFAEKSEVTTVEDDLAAHKTDAAAHADIRNAVSTAQDTADEALAAFDDLGDIAYKDTVGKTDLAAGVQASLNLADTAVQVETDPTVPAWAKAASKPSYSAGEVGADPAGTASGAVSSHNTNTAAHNDIRVLITGLTDRMNALANSDDATLDQMAEVVAYIKSNRTLIESITTNKVNVADIIDNLTTNVEDKPLSAAQGVALKALIDAIVIPVQSVNGMTGEVQLGASDVGADVSGTATSAVSGHNSSATAHTDIRSLIDEVRAAAEAAAAALNTHNSSATAHNDIRTAVSNVQDEVNAMAKLPAVTASDDGKFLRVVSGAWAAATIPNAEEATF